MTAAMAAEELLELEINGLAGRLCQLKLERFRPRKTTVFSKESMSYVAYVDMFNIV